MKIVKRLHHSESYQSEVNLFGSVIAKFELKPFGGGWMSYVIFKHQVNGVEVEYYGNSLWNLDIMSKSNLIKVISTYKNIQQVFKDFKRNFHESRFINRVH